MGGNLFSMIFMGALVVLITHDNYSLSKYFILLYAFAFGVSLGPVVWFYIPEILPAKGISIAVFINWMSALIIGLCFPIMA